MPAALTIGIENISGPQFAETGYAWGHGVCLGLLRKICQLPTSLVWPREAEVIQSEAQSRCFTPEDHHRKCFDIAGGHWETRQLSVNSPSSAICHSSYPLALVSLPPRGKQHFKPHIETCSRSAGVSPIRRNTASWWAEGEIPVLPVWRLGVTICFHCYNF